MDLLKTSMRSLPQEDFMDFLNKFFQKKIQHEVPFQKLVSKEYLALTWFICRK